ncbi:MAG: glycosyltransferase family 4 protein [Anaerolineae bacterium]
MSPRYYPYIGGSELYCQEISERLVQDGHQVTVFTTNAWDLEYFWDPQKAHLPVGRENYHGVEIQRFAVQHVLSSKWGFGAIRLAMRLVASMPFNTLPLLFRLCVWVPWVPDLERELAVGTPRGAYDIVHVTNICFDSLVYRAYRFARQQGIPLVITPFVHLGEREDETVRRYYTMPHQMTMLHNSDAVIVQTELERQYLLSQGVLAERIHKVGVGVNPEHLRGGCAERFRAKYGVQAPIVFYIGTQAYDKGTVHLVEAMRKLWDGGSEAHLVLAGPLTSSFESYFHSLPEADRQRCHLLGFISEEDKRDLLDAGDVFAMPSRTDSFGIVYLEAWLYKKPVIGALAGGVPDVIQDNEDGYLVPFGDVLRLAEVIGTLLADRAKARQFGEKATTRQSSSIPGTGNTLRSRKYMKDY